MKLRRGSSQPQRFFERLLLRKEITQWNLKEALDSEKASVIWARDDKKGRKKINWEVKASRIATSIQHPL